MNSNTRPINWHGSYADFQVLQSALDRNCACDPLTTRPCAPHMLLRDQHVLDHLLFARATREQMLHREFES